MTCIVREMMNNKILKKYKPIFKDGKLVVFVTDKRMSDGDKGILQKAIAEGYFNEQ